MQPSTLAETLLGPRITLQRARAIDDATLAILDAEHERFLLYFPMLDPALRGDALRSAFTRELHELWTQGEEFAYELRETASGRFLGHASVHAVQWKHECAELAYWVSAAASGQGYVAEAVAVLERTLFDLGFHRVEIRCDVLNTASARVAERAGYALDGILRGHMKRRDGTFRDSKVFGKLAHERPTSS